MQLLSQSKVYNEKKAMSLIRTLGVPALKGMRNIVKRDDFVGGLLAPIPKFFGGLQKTYGRGQQGIAALRQGLNSSADDLLKNPLYQRGARNVSRGNTFRERAGYLSGVSSAKPLQYRTGRVLGGLAIGAPLMNLPFTAAEYAGAANADPAFAEEYAKNMAYDRAEERLGQFQNMPFLDRMKAVYDPQSFTQQLQMPEATDLYQAMSDDNLNNPGIMKYLSSFNPFTGGPVDVINQKVRSEMMRNMQPKEASDKQAMQLLLNKATPVLRGMQTAFRRGRMTTKHNYNFAPTRKAPTLPGSSATPIWRAGLNRAAFEVGKSPGQAAFSTAAIGLPAYFLKHHYDQGKNEVYDAAANNAMGMADLQLMDKFNQPGFMGGLGRAGMAIAPGMGSDMILKQIRQSMFPEVNNMGQ